MLPNMGEALLLPHQCNFLSPVGSSSEVLAFDKHEAHTEVYVEFPFPVAKVPNDFLMSNISMQTVLANENTCKSELSPTPTMLSRSPSLIQCSFSSPSAS